MMKREYKNYRELCEELGEDCLTGNSKIAQMKRWGYWFKYHKEGRKIIIDKEYKGKERRKYREQRGCNNNKHVDKFLQVIRWGLSKGEIEDEYLGTQRLLGSVLKIIPPRAYKQMNGKGLSSEAFAMKMGLMEKGSFEEYLSVAGAVIKDTVVRAMNKLERQGELEFELGEVFIAKEGFRRYMCLDGYDDLVVDVESKICDDIAERLGKKTKGRQLIHFIKGQPTLMEEYRRRCIKELLKNKYLVRDLDKEHMKDNGRHLQLNTVAEYYKAVHVIKVKVADERKPTKEEMMEIYEDVKPRIRERLNICTNDIEIIERWLFTMWN